MTTIDSESPITITADGETVYQITQDGDVVWDHVFDDGFDVDSDPYYVKTEHIDRGGNTNGGWVWEPTNSLVRSDDSNDCLTLHTNPTELNIDTSRTLSVKATTLGTDDNDGLGILIYDDGADTWYEGGYTDDHGYNGIATRSRGNEPNEVASGDSYPVAETHDLELVYNGSKLTLFVDNDKSTEYDVSMTPSGFGLVNEACSPPVSFENLTVDYIEKKSYQGIQLGYASDDITYYLNQWGGSSNTGEIDLDGSQFTEPDGTTHDITPINNGIALAEDSAATGTWGHIMWSNESVHSRFSSNPPHSDNADHLIGVQYNSGWEYDNNGSFYSFTPRDTDYLIAEVVWGVNDLQKLHGF